MSNEDLINLWKNSEQREDAERQFEDIVNETLSELGIENPAGSVELIDEELDEVAGGAAMATEDVWTTGCCGGFSDAPLCTFGMTTMCLSWDHCTSPSPTE